MLRRVIKYHATANIWCRTTAPVRFYPRRSQPMAPQDALEYDTVDAFDETDITSEVDMIEEEFLSQTKQIEKERQRQWLKNKILQRKYFKQPKEVNLLTWTAKEQIRFLHAEHPDEWTVQKLARSFPVSETGIIKILKSNIIVHSQEDKDKHDRRVRRNWQQIQGELTQGNLSSRLHDGGVITDALRRLVEANKLTLMINAGGMENVTLPARAETNAKKVGVFEALVKGDNKASNRTQSITSDLDSKELLKDISNFKFQTTKKTGSSTDEERNDSDASSSGNSSDHSQMQFSRYQKRVMQKLESGSFGDSRVEDSHLDNLSLRGTGRLAGQSALEETQSDSRYSERVRYQWRREQGDVLSKIKYESRENDRGEPRETDRDGYIYDSRSGYQYPLGRTDERLERIKLPKSTERRPDLLVKGKYVYDEDGEFLYKIP